MIRTVAVLCAAAVTATAAAVTMTPSTARGAAPSHRAAPYARYGAAYAWRGAAPSGRVTAVDIAPGRVQFLLSADGLPPKARLDPASVRASVAGQDLPVSAEPPGAASQEAGSRPRRGVVVVLDTSGSMAGAPMTAARQGATRFLRTLPKDVPAGLATAGTADRVRIGPTTDRATLLRALAKVRAGGDTALYDAMAASLNGLGRLGSQVDRRIVVLSDGRDSASRTSLTALTGRLTREHVPVVVVAYRTSATSAPTLRRLASVSGGRLLPSPDTRRMVAAFADAAASFAQAMWITVRLPASLAGRSLRLDVEVRAGPETVRAAVPLLTARGTGPTPAAGATSSLADRAVVVRRPPGTPLQAALILWFLALLLLTATFLSSRKNPGHPAWAQHIDRYRLRGERRKADGHGTLVAAALGLSQRFISARGLEERMALDLDRGGMALRPHEWTLLRGTAALALSAILSVVTGNALVGLVAGPLVTWAATRAYLRSRVTRRLRAFADQLPDALRLMAGSLRAGFSVSQALDRVAGTGTQPLAPELGRALAETRLGVSVEDALGRVAARMECLDLSWVVMAIRIQREVGGNLADVLDTTVSTMRERAHIRRHIRSLTAEGRLSAYILIALPMVTTGTLFLVRRSYVRPLYTTPLGLLMLCASGAFVLLGWVWMRRLISVEP